jgi:predicted dienelactone hydrolase
MRLPITIGLVLGLFAGAGVHAQTCLDLATSHTDARDLDALRGDVETTCGCAAAASRRAYRSCAKGELKTAFTAGTIRAECRREAKRLVLRTTCGTTKTTCGLVRTSTLEQRGCRLRPAGRCTTRGNLLASPCADTHCADVEQWTAGTCVDPREPGPSDPGVREILMTKDSVAAPGTTRDLQVFVWYPALAGEGPIQASTGGVPNATPDASGGPRPLVLFSHGSCGFPLQSVFLTASLATRGFVVAAPSHPGNTLAEFPSCGTAGAQTASFLERPEDMIHVLDELLATAADPGSPFFGLIDETRIGMMGHSFGGLTTYLVAAREPRVVAAAPLAPFATIAPPLEIPSLTMIGAIDSTVPNQATRDRFAESTAPKQLVEIAHAGHYAFSGLCFPSPDCAPPATLTQDEAHALVLRWLVPFLEVYVAGDDALRPLLADPIPPGVSVETVL